MGDDQNQLVNSFAVKQITNAIENLKPLEIHIPESYPQMGMTVNGYELGIEDYRSKLRAQLRSVDNSLSKIQRFKDRHHKIEAINMISDQFAEVGVETKYYDDYNEWESILKDIKTGPLTTDRLHLEMQAEAAKSKIQDIHSIVKARRSAIDYINSMIIDAKNEIGKEFFEDDPPEFRLPALKACYNRLVEDEYIEAERFSHFSQIFTGEELKTPIKWKSDKAHLSAFFLLIRNSKRSDIIKLGKHFWKKTVVPNFVNEEGNYYDSKLLSDAGSHSQENTTIKEAFDLLVRD